MKMTDAEAAIELDGVGEALVQALRLVASIDAATAALQMALLGDDPNGPNRHFGLHTKLDHAVAVVERVADQLRRRTPSGNQTPRSLPQAQEREP